MHKSNSSGQKIKCTVSECTHNNIDSSTCRLEEILVSPCDAEYTKDPIKDTACSSYKFSEVQEIERY